ncbi:MAG: hypothetical protein AB1742_04290 [bacterium]
MKKRKAPRQLQPDPKIRTCANCLHFEVLEEGYDVARIEDLKYMLSACRLLGWKVKENYLFHVPGSIHLRTEKECPFWEPYN